MRKYTLPEVLEGKCSQKDYTHWLYAKAAAHVKRDTKRGNQVASAITYRDVIHSAVCQGGDKDAYTGRPLRWDLIRKYDNEKSKIGKREYKKEFADLPTVDHVGNGMSHPDFKICSWRTNDSKNDLTLEELTEVCRDVLKHNTKGGHQSQTEILLEMLSCGLLELRMLCRDGKTIQALSLSEALHNLPDYAAHPENWDPDYFVAEFSRYKSEHQTSQAVCKYDYLAYLARLKTMASAQPSASRKL